MNRINVGMIIVVILFVMAGCESFEKDFFKVKSRQEKCEETPCTDSLCLHWSFELNRCVTDSAKIRELKRKKEEQERIVSEMNDSIQIQQLKLIKAYLVTKDSILKEIAALLEKNLKNEEKMDSLSFQIKKMSFCRDMKKRYLADGSKEEILIRTLKICK